MTDDLDVALADLYPVPDDDPEALRRARARLLMATGQRPAGRRRWLTHASLAAAAAVVAVAAIAAVAIGREPEGAVVLVAQTLDRAAAAPVRAVDEPVPAGSYRYVAVHSMSGVFTNGDLGFLYGVRTEQWIPADQAGDWFRVTTDTGERTAVLGPISPADMAKSPPEKEIARCGAFGTTGPGPWCSDRGTWQVPTAAFVAGLPRDPHRLFERLRDDTAGRGRDPDQEVLVYAADALSSGLIPADLRSALYRALARLPTLELTERAATLDGLSGTALGVTADGLQEEIIVDPATGAFIGARSRWTRDRGALPAGTVTQWSSVRYGVAEAPWRQPADE